MLPSSSRTPSRPYFSGFWNSSLLAERPSASKITSGSTGDAELFGHDSLHPLGHRVRALKTAPLEPSRELGGEEHARDQEPAPQQQAHRNRQVKTP